MKTLVAQILIGALGLLIGLPLIAAFASVIIVLVFEAATVTNEAMTHLFHITPHGLHK